MWDFFSDHFSDSSHSLILVIGGIEHLVLSETDDKLGGPVCTLRTLKNPWQLEIEKSRTIKAAVRAELVPIMVFPGRASGLKQSQKNEQNNLRPLRRIDSNTQLD